MHGWCGGCRWARGNELSVLPGHPPPDVWRVARNCGARQSMWSLRRRPHLPLHQYAEGLSAHDRGRRHHRHPRRTRPGRPPRPCRAGHPSFFNWPALSVALADTAADDDQKRRARATTSDAAPLSAQEQQGGESLGRHADQVFNLGVGPWPARRDVAAPSLPEGAGGKRRRDEARGVERGRCRPRARILTVKRTVGPCPAPNGPSVGRPVGRRVTVTVRTRWSRFS